MAPYLGEQAGQHAAALLAEKRHAHGGPADRLAGLAVSALLIAGDLRDVAPVLGDDALAQHRLVVSQRLRPLARRLWARRNIFLIV